MSIDAPRLRESGRGKNVEERRASGVQEVNTGSRHDHAGRVALESVFSCQTSLSLTGGKSEKAS